MTIIIGCWLYIVLQNRYVVAVYTSVLMLWLCVSGVYWFLLSCCVKAFYGRSLMHVFRITSNYYWSQQSAVFRNIYSLTPCVIKCLLSDAVLLMKV